MKLLGWMHRKLRQNNNDVFKEFGTGGGGTCNCITGRPSPDHDTFLAATTDYFSTDASAADHPPPDIDTTDLFAFGGGGLLAIGTLGIAAIAIPEDGSDDCNEDILDAGDDGAATPTFGVNLPEADEEKTVSAVEAIAEKDDDATTEGDLMMVSAELEKVLGGGSDAVPSARVSFAVGVDCPLQGFLFGSPVSEAAAQSGQRESCGRRASLGELFMRTRFAEEKVSLVAVAVDGHGVDETGGGDKEEGKGGKGGGGDKVMKKRKAKDEKGGVGGGGGAPPTTGVVTKSKFQKILQIFHRKVYPESAILTRNPTKKNRKRGAPDSDRNNNGGRQEPTGDAETDESMASPKLRCRKECLPSFTCCTNRALLGPDKSELNGNKSGHWIKTDADYLVLEL